MTDDTVYTEIDALLDRHRLVAVVWSTADVLHEREDLTDDQAWAVLRECRRRHDCEVGFNWDSIREVAEALYPEPEEADEDGDKG